MADVYQLQSSVDRRLWNTSGGREAIMLGVVDDYGTIVPSHFRPGDTWQ